MSLSCQPTSVFMNKSTDTMSSSCGDQDEPLNAQLSSSPVAENHRSPGLLPDTHFPPSSNPVPPSPGSVALEQGDESRLDHSPANNTSVTESSHSAESLSADCHPPDAPTLPTVRRTTKFRRLICWRRGLKRPSGAN